MRSRAIAASSPRERQRRASSSAATAPAAAWRWRCCCRCARRSEKLPAGAVLFSPWTDLAATGDSHPAQRRERRHVPRPPHRRECADLSRRHAGHPSAGLAALCRSEGPAAALHAGERQRGAARRIRPGSPRRRRRRGSRSISASGGSCRMPGLISRRCCRKAAPRWRRRRPSSAASCRPRGP